MSRFTAAGMDEFGSILANRSIGVLFQPIVDLNSGEVEGLEALSRPPAGSSYAGPGELFAGVPARAGRRA